MMKVTSKTPQPTTRPVSRADTPTADRRYQYMAPMVAPSLRFAAQVAHGQSFGKR